MGLLCSGFTAMPRIIAPLRLGKLSRSVRPRYRPSDDSLTCFTRLHQHGLERREPHLSRRKAFQLRHELALAIVDRDARISTRLAEFGGKLCGFSDRAYWHLLALRVAQHNMRAGIIGGMKPEVEG